MVGILYADDADEEVLTLTLTTKLGVQRTIKYIFIEKCGSEALDRLVNAGYPKSIPLKIAEHIYLFIALNEIKQFDLSKSKLTLHLYDGSQYSGIPVNCTIKGQTVEGRQDVSYQLNSLVSIDVVNSGTRSNDSSDGNWRLSISSGSKSGSTFVGCDPKFVFSSSAGYLIGQGVSLDNKFWVVIGGEEISGNLSDFAQISFARSSNRNHMINITSNSGIKNKGALRLKGHDDRGYHHGTYLGLVLTLKTYYQIFVFVDNKLNWHLAAEKSENN
jgi:hypothetical protein